MANIKLKDYFSDLEKLSKTIDTIEGNLYICENISFEGTAKGSEEAAIKFVKHAKPKLEQLKEKLNEVFKRD